MDNITLTNLQKAIINKTGKFVIKACPGSGKTITVAERTKKIIREWTESHRGIAIISFTNVAWQEIEKYLSNEIIISYPHFLGSIDSFMNRYIFLPFGHLIMKCNKRPELVGQPYNDWEPINNGLYWRNYECQKNECKLNNFSYDINDQLTDFSSRNHFNNCQSKHAYCQKNKTNFTLKGFATQLDANYFAMKVLENFSGIAKALAYRFPLIMLDEAQDTSAIQIRILETLIKNGIEDIMFVGDPDQAIYAWRTAEPNLFKEKYKQWESNSEILDENWRSSQHICNFFSKISSLNNIPKAMSNDCKGYQITPDIWGYKIDEIQLVVDKFMNLCKNNSIKFTPQNIAILTRSRELLYQISKSNIKIQRIFPWANDCMYAKDIIKAKFMFEKGLFAKSFIIMERVVFKIITDSQYYNTEEISKISSEYGIVKWRNDIYNILLVLPNIKYLLGVWIIESNKVLQTNNNIIINSKPDFCLRIKKDRKPYIYSALNIEELFTEIEDSKICLTNYTLGTVHSIKGETFEAVLFFSKKKGGDNRSYETILNSNIVESEEMRIIYVAISRPRRILIVATPEEDTFIWKSKFCV